MSTRCQIEFRRDWSNGRSERRTVYRHSDGYPSAVIEDLQAFLAWSTCRGDVAYEAANFLYWSKCQVAKRYPQHEQLGFGVCVNDRLQGDIEYYYVVWYDERGCTIHVHHVTYADGEQELGLPIDCITVPYSSLLRNAA